MIKKRILFFLYYWIFFPFVRFSISYLFFFLVRLWFDIDNLNLLVFSASENSASYAINEGPNWSFDLNKMPPVVFEHSQILEVNNFHHSFGRDGDARNKK